MDNNSYKILLVDDDRFIQRVIGRSLTQLGYHVDIAADGVEGLRQLQASGGYDLVLLDRDMPNMDGITMLKKLKSIPDCIHLPVIMLTGADRPEDVAEGLAAGAYYYLTKPATQVILQRVIESALDTYQKTNALRQTLGRQKSNLGLIKKAIFSYHSLKEARDIALLLADASGFPERTVGGYSELLINAVEHGNLEISYEEKGRLLEAERWEEEIERRLALPLYAERSVEVVMHRQPESLIVTITDEGKGFDWQSYLQISPERAFDLHGRGIAMSKELSFDRLVYQGVGNRAVATVNF